MSICRSPLRFTRIFHGFRGRLGRLGLRDEIYGYSHR